MSHRVAAVSVLKADPVHGVVRFLQDGDSTTVTVSWFFCGCLVWWWCLGCKGGKEKGGGGGDIGDPAIRGGAELCRTREKKQGRSEEGRRCSAACAELSGLGANYLPCFVSIT